MQSTGNLSSNINPSRRARHLVMAAFGLGFLLPVVPGLLLASRSTDAWVRRQAMLAARLQTILLFALIVGGAVLRLGLNALRNRSGHVLIQFRIASVISTIEHSPAGAASVLAGGILTGAALAGWWGGNLLAAIGAWRGDDLGWPRLGRRRRAAE
jgi:hypothetical protein